MSSGSSLRLDAAVKARFQLSWGKAREWIATGKVWVNGTQVADPARMVSDADQVELKMNTPRAAAKTPAELPVPEVIYQDSQLIVVNKPAGMNSVPYENERGRSLEEWVCGHLRQPKVTVVHRLDRETSGLLVFARSRESGKDLANQFRFRTVQRRYLALAQGRVESQTIRSILIENRGDGLRGSLRPGMRVSEDEAKPAVTHVERLASLRGFSLIECRLETGRTHQIRIHLSETGHPLLGEKAYIREYSGPRVEAPRLMLHAMELGVLHPIRREPLHWLQAPPADFLALLDEKTRARVLEEADQG